MVAQAMRIAARAVTLGLQACSYAADEEKMEADLHQAQIDGEEINHTPTLRSEGRRGRPTLDTGVAGTPLRRTPESIGRS